MQLRRDLVEMGAEARIELAQLVSKILDAWGLSDDQSCGVLGVNTPSLLHDLSCGKPLPVNEEVLERALHLAAIYEALHCGNLGRPDLADSWVTRPSAELDGRLPVEIMADSVEALAEIRRLVESDAPTSFTSRLKMRNSD